MSAPYGSARPESGTFDAALSALADATLAHIDEHGVRVVSVKAGIGKSTAHEWGGDLDRWTVAKFLRVAAADPVMWDALLGIRRAAVVHADSTDVERLTSRAIADQAAGIEMRNRHLADSRIDHGEAREEIARIDVEIAHRIEEKAALMARMGRQP